jgi:hypothetical protein
MERLVPHVDVGRAFQDRRVPTSLICAVLVVSIDVPEEGPQQVPRLTFEGTGVDDYSVSESSS